MTNKEAAEFIWDVLDGTKSFNEKGGRGLEALDLAIKALKNEKAKEGELIKAYTKGFDAGVETVKKPKKGGWICVTKSTFPQYQPDEYKCPFCNVIVHRKTNYCEYCGADMRGAE